jgi:hypothetical protein
MNSVNVGDFGGAVILIVFFNSVSDRLIDLSELIVVN